MWLITVAGVVIVLIGILQIAFPDITRSLDRFANDLEGVETKHGERYEMARVIRGLVMIAMGVVIVIVSFSI